MIKISLTISGYIYVRDVDIDCEGYEVLSAGNTGYYIPADELAVNCFGNQETITWREAFEQGLIQVVDEDHPASGMLGAIYV